MDGRRWKIPSAHKARAREFLPAAAAEAQTRGCLGCGRQGGAGLRGASGRRPVPHMLLAWLAAHFRPLDSTSGWGEPDAKMARPCSGGNNGPGLMAPGAAGREGALAGQQCCCVE